MEVSTYTESHRLSYIKRKDFELERMKLYYQANKQQIKENRRARYAAKKLLIN